MENSATTGSVVNSIEVQIDNFLEHFKRTSKAMEHATEDESPLVRRGNGSSGSRACSTSRPVSMGLFDNSNGAQSSAEGYDCLHDADGLLLVDSHSEGRYHYNKYVHTVQLLLCGLCCVGGWGAVTMGVHGTIIIIICRNSMCA